MSESRTAADVTPEPVPVLSVEPALPLSPHDAAAAPGDTDLGWRLASLLLFMSAALRVVTLINSSVADPDATVVAPSARGGGGGGGGVGDLWFLFVIIGLTLTIVAAVGLRNGQVWAKWLTLVMVIIGGVMMICAAYLMKRSSQPFGSRLPLVGAAIWLMAGWYILLDRPTNRTKVAVGFGITAAWYVASFVYVLASGEQ